MDGCDEPLQDGPSRDGLSRNEPSLEERSFEEDARNSQPQPNDWPLRRPIPPKLHSAFAEGPFERCTICSCSLLSRPITNGGNGSHPGGLAIDGNNVNLLRNAAT